MSTDSKGEKVLWNTLEGLTCMWDLVDGDVKGRWESYVRSGEEGSEPGKCFYSSTALWMLNATDYLR